MLSDCSIASAKPHVANLAFAKIFENAIGAIAVRISVLKSLFARDDNDQRMLGRCYNPSLLLPAKARMNVDPPIINAANLETPTHDGL
jgi:hypothetical protein